MARGKGKSWVEKIADQVERRVRQADPERKKIVCASGISPSGPIHLGNMRELMTVHLVAEELRARGWDAEHIHSWDDYDRLRKIPEVVAGVDVPADFAEHIGRPLAAVPDPAGEFPSYAERFMHQFTESVERIGIPVRFIRQSEAYPAGQYLDSIKRAMEHRFEIFDILADYQTAGRHEKSVEERRLEYYPFRVYCHACQRDTTRVTAYEADTATVTYRCDAEGGCGHGGTFSLDDEIPGKLVWKVDWPMRWRFEGVDFEPGGEDHSAPGSSFTVGQRIVRDIYGAEPPFYTGYAFVGISGQTKMSSSSGTSATPEAALDILEPCILRWLYLRRNVRQQFTIDFGQEMLRLYDEWDAFCRRVESGEANDMQRRVHEICTQTSKGAVACTGFPVSFRLLSSAADLTQGNLEQILRIVEEHLDEAPPANLREALEPRLTCAINWVTRYVPDDQRTQVKTEFDAELRASLDATQVEGIERFLDMADERWTLDGLTGLVYGIPKLQFGLQLDDPPTPEIKTAQRQFFIALYQHLVGRDTGPRLPTLLLSLGRDKVRSLLTAPS